MPAAGVPERTPAVLSVTPLGSAPNSENVDAGVPVAVAVNVPAVPTIKVMLQNGITSRSKLVQT